MDIQSDTFPPECHDRRDADAAGGGPAVTVMSIGQIATQFFSGDDLRQLAAAGRLTVDLTDWSGLPLKDALTAAENLSQLATGGIAADLAVAGENREDAYAAALAAVTNAAGENVTGMRRVLVWLASQRPVGGWEADAEQIAVTLRAAGIKGLRKDTILKEVRDDAAEAAGYRPTYVGDVLIPDGLPAGAGHLEVPHGYRLSEGGVFCGTGSDESKMQKNCGRPVLIVGRIVDQVTGTHTLTLAWRDEERWQTREVERATVACNRDLVTLAAYGFPVITDIASDLTRYLHNFEHVNSAAIPTHRTLGHTGWVDDDDPGRGYLLPDRHIGCPAGATPLRLRSSDAGTAQLHCQVRARGTLDGWRGVVTAAAPHPVVRLTLLASLAAPLLAVLGRSKFAVMLSGITSTGKTTTQRVAASVWGNPGPDDPSLVMSMNQTRVYTERTAQVLRDLPLILDDTSKCRRADDVEKLLYDVDGGGRGRGTRDGLAETRASRSIYILSGESSLGDHTEAGGARARTLQVPLPPFGESSAETSGLVGRLVAGLAENHGHAGPAFVGFILANRQHWAEWSVGVNNAARSLAGDDSGPVQRLAGHAALLQFVDRLATEAGVLPFDDGRDVVSELWPILREGAVEADRAAATLTRMVEYAVAHPGEFGGERSGGPGAPQGPVRSGKWYGQGPGTKLAIFPEKVRSILGETGLSYDTMVAAWRDRGWLDYEPGRYTKSVRFSEKSVKCLVITAAAVEQVAGVQQTGQTGLSSLYPGPAMSLPVSRN